MINRELIELRSNEIAMEALHDIAMDLPPIERSKYVEIVTEAMITNPDTQLKIITKLAKQVEGLQQIDLEQCRKSMGNITKYKYYDALAKAMEIINESDATADIPNVVRMNKIHNILLDNADDFIWGFKKNEMIVTKMYCLMTRLLFIMIDLSISDYIKKLEVSFKFNSKLDATPAKVITVVKDADSMIKLFESGDWRLVMNSAKKSATKRAMAAIDEMEGTEPPTSMANEATVPSDKDSAIRTIWSWITGLPNAAKVGLIIIAILLSYRKVAFFVAKLGAKFANVVRHSAELIKNYGAANRDQSDSAVEKQNKLYNSLIGMADRIDAFFDKASRETEKDIKEANRNDFNTNEITTINAIDFDV